MSGIVTGRAVINIVAGAAVKGIARSDPAVIHTQPPLRRRRPGGCRRAWPELVMVSC